MKQYLKNWHFARLLRLAIGIAVVIQGILVQDVLLIILGGLFSLMPLMNIGCGPTGSCSTGGSFRKTLPSEKFNTNENK